MNRDVIVLSIVILSLVTLYLFIPHNHSKTVNNPINSSTNNSLTNMVNNTVFVPFTIKSPVKGDKFPVINNVSIVRYEFTGSGSIDPKDIKCNGCTLLDILDDTGKGRMYKINFNGTLVLYFKIKVLSDKFSISGEYFVVNFSRCDNTIVVSSTHI